MVVVIPVAAAAAVVIPEEVIRAESEFRFLGFRAESRFPFQAAGLIHFKFRNAATVR